MIRKTLLAAILVSIAACETVPVQMPPEAFDAVMTETAAHTSVPYVERLIAEALEREDLSVSQRMALLQQRADKRSEARYDLPGAIADLETVIGEASEGQDTSDVEAQKSQITTMIEQVEGRLSGLQNLRNWFDDKVAMGALDEAALRYQRSKLTPTAQQTYTLQEAGFVCAKGERDGGDAYHTFGPVPDFAEGLVWCDALPDS